MQFFGRQPDMVIPHSELFDIAANAGSPFISSHPDAAGALDIRELARRVMEATYDGP